MTAKDGTMLFAHGLWVSEGGNNIVERVVITDIVHITLPEGRGPKIAGSAVCLCQQLGLCPCLRDKFLNFFTTGNEYPGGC